MYLSARSRCSIYKEENVCRWLLDDADTTGRCNIWYRSREVDITAIVVKPVDHYSLIHTNRAFASNLLTRAQDFAILVLIDLLLGQSDTCTVGDEDFDWVSGLVHDVYCIFG